ncbi:Uncharacterised protein [Paraprevotella clara]|uniref:Uncharacterized protein n=1 Tax=Paraprevotella clara TaxID=454154 RepID=A0A6N3GGY8_9BACT
MRCKITLFSAIMQIFQTLIPIKALKKRSWKSSSLKL